MAPKKASDPKASLPPAAATGSTGAAAASAAEVESPKKRTRKPKAESQARPVRHRAKKAKAVVSPAMATSVTPVLAPAHILAPAMETAPPQPPSEKMMAFERTSGPVLVRSSGVRVLASKPLNAPTFDVMPTHDQIELRAYFLWLDRGCPFGSPEVDWFQAERELAPSLVARTA